jgi:hypothetical protein
MLLTYILAIITLLIVVAYFCIKNANKQREEFYRQNGRLNELDFDSDIKGKYFRWNDVKPCLDSVLARDNFKQHDSCPECNLPSEQLVWINYTSSKKSWEHLAGQKGSLSICPNCRVQVEFLCYKVS